MNYLSLLPDKYVIAANKEQLLAAIGECIGFAGVTEIQVRDVGFTIQLTTGDAHVLKKLQRRIRQFPKSCFGYDDTL